MQLSICSDCTAWQSIAKQTRAEGAACKKQYLEMHAMAALG